MCFLGTHCAPLQLVTYFTWDDMKNEKLKAERGIGFEEIVFLIGQGHLLDVLEPPNQQRYGGQRIFVVQRDDYVYLVPFVEDDTRSALKAIIPSRKASKQYVEKESDDDESLIRTNATSSTRWNVASGDRSERRSAPKADTGAPPGNLPQRSSAEHSHFHEGSGSDSETGDRGGTPYQTLIASLLP